MNSQEQSIQQIQEIKTMMERSCRFISLSGWSGISAGLCGLVGAGLAHRAITSYYANDYLLSFHAASDLFNSLLSIAIVVFLSALLLAFIFTFLKSKKQKIKLWDSSAQRLLWNTCLPMLIGGIFILRLVAFNQYDFVASACLIFYGLGLVNGSKYTLSEVRFLGYAELILGIANLFFVKESLLFWTIGFGICHVVYGIAMWWKYERLDTETE